MGYTRFEPNGPSKLKRFLAVGGKVQFRNIASERTSNLGKHYSVTENIDVVEGGPYGCSNEISVNLMMNSGQELPNMTRSWYLSSMSGYY